MLHLVPKTPAPSYLDAFSKSHEDLTPLQEPYKHKFFCDFQEVSAKLFSFLARNPRHNLSCSLLLDLQDIFVSEGDDETQGDHLTPMLVCEFPSIDGNMLYDLVYGDEYLHGVLMVRFYLDILESIFLFCEEKNARGLILTIDDSCNEAIEIYRNFISSETQVSTEKGTQTQIVISTNHLAYDDLIDFIEKIDHDFHQTLWRHQKDNPSMRHYLKSFAVS